MSPAGWRQRLGLPPRRGMGERPRGEVEGEKRPGNGQACHQQAHPPRGWCLFEQHRAIEGSVRTDIPCQDTSPVSLRLTLGTPCLIVSLANSCEPVLSGNGLTATTPVTGNHICHGQYPPSRRNYAKMPTIFCGDQLALQSPGDRPLRKRKPGMDRQDHPGSICVSRQVDLPRYTV